MFATWVDWVIVAVVLFSALLSFFRGFVREILSLICWGVAVVVPWLYSEPVASHLESIITAPALRLLTAGIFLFLITLVVGTLVGKLLGSLTRKIGLSGLDRSLAAVFGALRGAVILMLLVSGARYLPVQKNDSWRQSVLVPYVESGAARARQWMSEFLDSVQQE